MMTEVCVFQFIKTQDVMNGKELVDLDMWGLRLIRTIITFYQPSQQPAVLQRIVKGIVNDINNRVKPYKPYEQCKLNLKIMHLVQFIEELWIANKSQFLD